MKYYYQVQIQILVVKCHNCGTHHAIIPSFSLPGTSLGTMEVEIFYEKRASGSSRNEAGEELLKKGVSQKHLKHIEKRITRGVRQMKALFPDRADKTMPFYAWIMRFLSIANLKNFIREMNRTCLSHGFNAVFCSRINIILFGKNKTEEGSSNDMDSPARPTIGIDSS